MPDRTDRTPPDVTIARAGSALTRRDLLVGSATLAAGALAGSKARAVGERVDPFHDPAYSLLPPRFALVDRLSPSARQAQEKPRSINGIRVTGLPDSVPELDDKIVGIMAGSGIPGVSLALAKNDALALTRGYGRASVAGNVPVEPTMPATIMSVSKTVTAMAALTLVRDGKLRLNDLAFEVLQEGPLLAPDQPFDRRQYKIEVHHLMSHTSGLFNAVETLNDPPRFQALAQRGAIRLIHGRIGQNDLVRVGMNKPLLFNPGEKFAYSGQGMQVLARVVEKVGGRRLDRYIQEEMFDPLGIRSYYVVTYLNDPQYDAFMKPNREALYAMAPAVFDKTRNVHRPRLAARGEYMSWGQADACGWGSLNALDLLRFVSAVPSVVGATLWRHLTERPPVFNDAGKPCPFGLGWVVVEKDGRKGINHNGIRPGERSFTALRPDGGSLAILINSDNDMGVRRIIAAAGELLDRLDSLHLQSPRWQDYGFAT